MMSLVDYSDTGSESSLVEEETSHKEDLGPSKDFCMKRRCSDDACLNLKRVRKSTLSDGFLSMEGSDTEDVSPNLKHAGRIRSMPHVRGNWPTFVYCTFQPPPDLINVVSDIIERATHDVPTLKKVKLLENGLHISLSKTVYLKSFQIDRFAELLKKRCSILHRFEIGFSGITSYVNDDGTRSFLGLDIGYGHQQLLSCLDAVDTVIKEFRKETFYETPRFHTSIAWALGDVVDEGVARIVGDLLPLLAPFRIPIPVISCRIGNRFFTYDLAC